MYEGEDTLNHCVNENPVSLPCSCRDWSSQPEVWLVLGEETVLPHFISLLSVLCSGASFGWDLLKKEKKIGTGKVLLCGLKLESSNSEGLLKLKMEVNCVDAQA